VFSLDFHSDIIFMSSQQEVSEGVVIPINSDHCTHQSQYLQVNASKKERERERERSRQEAAGQKTLHEDNDEV
jgi:hypothetical protein